MWKKSKDTRLLEKRALAALGLFATSWAHAVDLPQSGDVLKLSCQTTTPTKAAEKLQIPKFPMHLNLSNCSTSTGTCQAAPFPATAISTYGDLKSFDPAFYHLTSSRVGESKGVSDTAGATLYFGGGLYMIDHSFSKAYADVNVPIPEGLGVDKIKYTGEVKTDFKFSGITGLATSSLSSEGSFLASKDFPKETKCTTPPPYQSCGNVTVHDPQTCYRQESVSNPDYDNCKERNRERQQTYTDKQFYCLHQYPGYTDAYYVCDNDARDWRKDHPDETCPFYVTVSQPYDCGSDHTEYKCTTIYPPTSCVTYPAHTATMAQKDDLKFDRAWACSSSLIRKCDYISGRVDDEISTYDSYSAILDVAKDLNWRDIASTSTRIVNKAKKSACDLKAILQRDYWSCPSADFNFDSVGCSQ